jgi:MoxR-like ATPase
VIRRTIAIGEVEVLLAEPMAVPAASRFVTRNSLLERCRSAWGMDQESDGVYCLASHSIAMSFRLEGPPGSGKNELVYQLARELGCALYMQNGHEDLGPEDLSLLLVPGRGVTGALPLSLHASPLATAILCGGLFFFDNIDRVPERTLATLASVLDDRRMLYSAATGIWIQADAVSSFRFCCALDPADGRGLPAYIEQRTTPAIRIPLPDSCELREMLDWESTIQPDDVRAFKVSHERLQQKELETHGEIRRAEILERLQRLQDRDLRHRFSSAMAHAQAGYWEEAGAVFEALAEELPKDDSLRWVCQNNFSHSKMELGELNEALILCNNLLCEAPNFDVAVCTKADILYELSRCMAGNARDLREEARAGYHRAAELTRKDFIREHIEERLRELSTPFKPNR